MRILIAVDESEFSNAAVTSVTGRAWPDSSEFLVVSVADPLMTDIGGWIPESEKKRHQELIDTKLEQLKLGLPQHKIAGELGEGIPSDEIVRIAKEWHADFIIVGSHGRRGFDHALLGSVAESVAHKAPCSVEIIKMPHIVQSGISRSSSATSLEE